MRLLRVVFSFSFLFVLASHVAAQQPPRRDSQAVSIVQHALFATGGTQSSLAIQDSVTTGIVQYVRSNQIVRVPIVIKSRGTKSIRYELQEQDGTKIRVVNQGRAVIQTPDGRVTELIGNNTLAERVNHIPALSLLSDLGDGSVDVEDGGDGTVNGQPADVVALAFHPAAHAAVAEKQRDMTRRLFYIDRATKTVSKIQYPRFAENRPGSSQKVEVLLSDYRSISGVLVPFKQITYFDGKLMSELSISSVMFNVGLPESDFVLPQRR